MNYPDDMQLTPPMSTRKRRPDDDDDDSSTISSVWQHAFKRLRVNDHDIYLPSNRGFGNENVYWAQSYPPQQQQQAASTQQHNTRLELSTPPPKAPPVRPPDTDYRNNNEYLGQLHRERRLREQHQARCLFTAEKQAWNGLSTTMEESPVVAPGIYHRLADASVHTPTQQQQQSRKVVHLHTDSKLG